MNSFKHVADILLLSAALITCMRCGGTVQLSANEWPQEASLGIVSIKPGDSAQRAVHPEQTTIESEPVTLEALAFTPSSFQLPGTLTVLGSMIWPLGLLPASGVGGQVIVHNNELYNYDAARGKWLTANRYQMRFGNNAVVTNGYLAPFAGWTTNSTGFYVPRDATLTGLSVIAMGNIWRVASVGGDFTDLASALASASVVDGDTILLASETFTTASTITINKSVRIIGQSGVNSIIQTAGTAADPVNVLNVTAAAVELLNFTVKQRKTTNTGVETAVTISTILGGVILNALRVESMNTGVFVDTTANWTIYHCWFHHTGTFGVNHQSILVNGFTGVCQILDCSFLPSDETPSRTTFCYLTGPTTCNGTFVLESNSQAGSGHLRQFFEQDSFAGAAGGVEFFCLDNYYNETDASIVFYMNATDQLDLFGLIAVEENRCSNAHHKGLVTLDGSGVLGTPGTPLWYFLNNTIASPGITAPGYADATAAASLVGYNTTVFPPPLSVTYSTAHVTPTAPFPSFIIAVRKNGLASAIFYLFVSGMGGFIPLNFNVNAGDVMQVYLYGTLSKPIVALEYAYREA